MLHMFQLFCDNNSMIGAEIKFPIDKILRLQT